MPQRAFGAVLERAQNFGGDLRGREDALADLKAHDRAAEIGEGVARAIFGRDFVAAQSHVALDRSNHGAVFAAGKADRADAAVALDGQMRFHLDCAFADGDCRHQAQSRRRSAAVRCPSRRPESRAARHFPSRRSGCWWCRGLCQKFVAIFLVLSQRFRRPLSSRARDRRRESGCAGRRYSRGSPSIPIVSIFSSAG